LSATTKSTVPNHRIIHLKYHRHHKLGRYSTFNVHGLDSLSDSCSEEVKQSTCTTEASTSSTVVYKCLQCSRLFLSLASAQEHRLTKHVCRNKLIGCDLCGNTYSLEQEARSCFDQHKQTV